MHGQFTQRINDLINSNLINAVDIAIDRKMKIFGVVGKNGGYVKKNSNHIVVVPSKDENLITPISESFQSLIWHSIVSHPNLQINKTKW